jgi:aryl-alcohol dehydrogenase-like predicted oxidoreductase
VSTIGLGGNTFGRFIDGAQTTRIVQTALEHGVNFFDTAETYGLGVSEEMLGRALAGRRHEAIIGTKTGWQIGEGPNQRGSSRWRIMEAVHASLRRLETDYVDLVMIHRWDPLTPIEETLAALDDLVRQGKIRYIGCSNFAGWQLVSSLWTSDRRGYASFAVAEMEYSLLARDIEVDVLPACRAFGIGVIPYFPLAGGVLTGKYRPGEPVPAGVRGHDNQRFARLFLQPHQLEAVPRLEAWAQARGHTITELALAWLLAEPAVCTVITGTTKPEQVEANLRAAEWELTPAEAAEVSALAPVVLAPDLFLRSVAPEKL